MSGNRIHPKEEPTNVVDTVVVTHTVRNNNDENGSAVDDDSEISQIGSNAPNFEPNPPASPIVADNSAAAANHPDGRPPLIPPLVHNTEQHIAQTNDHPPPRPDPVHDRLFSTGEFSFLSALTETSSGDAAAAHPTTTRPPPPSRPSNPRRNRSVSFEQHVADQFVNNNNNKPPSPTILQPVLTTTAADAWQRGNTGITTDAATTVNSPTTTTTSRNKKQSSMNNLVKQVNPLECEAETAILRAMEQQHAVDEMNRPLKYFPEEGLDMYDSVESTSNSPARQNHPVVHSSPKTAKGSANANAPSLERPVHRRGKSNYSMANRDRTDSIEATLFDLTTAMRAMHNNDTDAAADKEGERHHQHHRRLGSSTGMIRIDHGDFATHAAGGDPPAVQDIPESSADVLVHNAHVLFRRNVARDDAPDTPQGTGHAIHSKNDLEKPASRRRLFSGDGGAAAVRDPKKTDGDSEHLSMGLVEELNESSFDETSSSSHRREYAVDIEQGVILSQDPSGAKATQPRKNNSAIRRSSVAIVNGTKAVVQRAKRGAKEDWEFFSAFISPMHASIKTYCKTVLLYILLPSIALAAILFYAAGNPLLKKSGASISWLILFLVRQIVTFTMAKAMELLVIDFLSLRSRWTVRAFGPTTTLFLVQSKGFPFILIVWGLFSLILLSGDNSLVHHWLYWQELIDMCNENNPSGDIPSSEANYRILASAIIVGIVVAVKRVALGLYLGKRTLSHYGEKLAKVIQSMVLVSEVAQLGRDSEPVGTESGVRKTQKFSFGPITGWDIGINNHKSEDESDSSLLPEKSLASPRRHDNASLGQSEKVIDDEQRDGLTGTLTASQRIKMMQLLDDWEEPEVIRKQKVISINAILQFRQALAFMDAEFPFSFSFGYAGNREACIESAQKVYKTLLRITPDKILLPFDTIGMLATEADGEIDQKKMRALIKIFRPDRQGNLSMLDFVRSCDSVYKEVKLLRSSIANSGQIDNALETMLNVVFYVMLTCLLLAANGFNPLAIFLSFSSVILAFAFMIGAASSKYFEGILFILLQRPYSIGDLVAIAGPNSDTAFHGAIPWYVLSVNLFTTTIKYAATGEVATISNGALASSRIINGARSPAPINHVFMKFGVDVPYTKVQLFHKTVESFVKERPREWVTMHQFRATRIAPEQGYIEYVIVLQHRERWQNLPAILMSQSDMASYVLEVSKQLDMRYHAPAMPVDLSMTKEKSSCTSSGDNEDDGMTEHNTGTDEKLRALSSLFAARSVSG